MYIDTNTPLQERDFTFHNHKQLQRRGFVWRISNRENDFLLVVSPGEGRLYRKLFLYKMSVEPCRRGVHVECVLNGKVYAGGVPVGDVFIGPPTGGDTVVGANMGGLPIGGAPVVEVPV